MAEVTSEKSRLERVIEHFHRYGVEYVVIGGQAEVLYGSARMTRDVDICYRRTSENLKRLAESLRALNPGLRGAPPDLKFRLDAESLALGCNFTFTTPLGDIDLLGEVEPVGDYDDIMRGATELDVGGFPVQVMNLDDLIAVKKYILRPKDQDSLVNLLAVKRELERQGEVGEQS